MITSNQPPTMEQNNKNLSDITRQDYDPSKDPEVEEDMPLILSALNKFRDRMRPYQRWIMITGFIILVMLVVYMGYARGALDVCNDLGGRLEIDIVHIVCHPGQYNPSVSDPLGNTLPDFVIQDG